MLGIQTDYYFIPFIIKDLNLYFYQKILNNFNIIHKKIIFFYLMRGLIFDRLT